MSDGDSGNVALKVSTFLSVNVAVVSNLPPAVLQTIAVQASKFEHLKSQKLLDDVTYGKYAC